MRKHTPVLLILIFCFSNCSSLFAQEEHLLPVRFSLFDANYAILNPAVLNMQESKTLAIGTQLTTGGFENIYSFYANGVTAIFPNGRPAQRLGISVIGDWEGELITRSWFTLMYSIEIPLTEKIKLGSGAHIGLMNYLVRSTTVSAGGGDMETIISWGLKIRDERGHLGLALNQINQPTLIPVEQPIQLNRHINLTTEYQFQTSRVLTLTPAFWVRWPQEGIEEYTFSTEALLNDIFSFQTLWFYDRNISFAVGFKNIRLSTINLGVQFSYTVPFGPEVFDQFRLYEAHVNMTNF